MIFAKSILPWKLVFPLSTLCQSGLIYLDNYNFFNQNYFFLEKNEAKTQDEFSKSDLFQYRI